MRRVVIVGLVLLVGVALLLLGRQWTSTTAPAPIPEQLATRQPVVESKTVRA
jgi:hypothetical protein